MVENVRQKMHMRLQSLIHELMIVVQTDSRLYEPAWKSNMGMRDGRRRVREEYREHFHKEFPGCVIEFKLDRGLGDKVLINPPKNYGMYAPVVEVLPLSVSHAVFFGCEPKDVPVRKYEVT